MRTIQKDLAGVRFLNLVHVPVTLVVFGAQEAGVWEAGA